MSVVLPAFQMLERSVVVCRAKYPCQSQSAVSPPRDSAPIGLGSGNSGGAAPADSAAGLPFRPARMSRARRSISGSGFPGTERLHFLHEHREPPGQPDVLLLQSPDAVLDRPAPLSPPRRAVAPFH